MSGATAAPYFRQVSGRLGVSTPSSSQRPSRQRSTLRLQEIAQTDQDSVYHAPRAPDWLWLGVFAAVVLGCGAWVWAQLGIDSAAGRAVFFGAALLALLWAALIYTFKLSVSVAVGPGGISLRRGPWRTQLPWAEVGRLVERSKVSNGQRF